MSAKKDKPDPSQPLANARHEAFAVAWAKGAAGAEAARQAGYSARRAKQSACEIVTNRDVVARKEWLQRQTATTSTMAESEKREILASIARNPAERASDRIAAIRADNDLAGDGSHAKSDDALTKFMQGVAARD